MDGWGLPRLEICLRNPAEGPWVSKPLARQEEEVRQLDDRKLPSFSMLLKTRGGSATKLRRGVKTQKMEVAKRWKMSAVHPSPRL